MSKSLLGRILGHFGLVGGKEFEKELEEKYNNLSTEELKKIINEYESHSKIYRVLAPEKEYLGYYVASEIINKREEEKK